jgi:hypothetical protein
MWFTNYRERYKYFLIPFFILLLLVIVLENTYLKKLPFIVLLYADPGVDSLFYVVLKKKRKATLDLLI